MNRISMLVALAIISMTSASVQASPRLSLEARLQLTIEYCYLIDVKEANADHVEFTIKQIFREEGKTRPRIKLYGRAPGKGLHIVMASDNHPTDSEWNEYQWYFYPVISDQDGALIIQNIVMDNAIETGKYLDMPIADFKLLVLLNSFKPRDGRKAQADYKRLAKMADWVWKDDYADPLYCLSRATGKYNVTIGNANSPILFEKFEYRIRLKDHEIYNWTSSAFGAFRISGNYLYCAYGFFRIKAIDLSTNKELWDRSLVGLGPSREITSPYPLNLYSNSNALVVFGNAPQGRFLEIKDAKTGKTIGHKIFKILKAPD